MLSRVDQGSGSRDLMVGHAAKLGGGNGVFAGRLLWRLHLAFVQRTTFMTALKGFDQVYHAEVDNPRQQLQGQRERHTDSDEKKQASV